MKIILTSDLDHISFSEHFFDLYIPKRLIEIILYKENINVKFNRVFNFLKSLLKNKLNNTEEFLMFHKQNNLPISYFVAINKGKSLNYSKKTLFKHYKNYLSDVQIFLHGQHKDNLQKLINEKNEFESLFGFQPLGIRMHYLDSNIETENLISKLYKFDSSVYNSKGFYMNNNLFVFPINIMDVYEFLNCNDLNLVINNTISKIEKAKSDKLDYFIINFHDVYFSDTYPHLKNYYISIINYLRTNNFDFIYYKDLL